MVETTIHSVLLFDGHTKRPNTTVVFDSTGGKIISVTTDAEHSRRPPGANVIDGRGHTLLPGLIDSHIHCYSVHLPPGGNRDNILRSPLKCGVTTVCDMHSDLASVQYHWNAIADEFSGARESEGPVTRSDLKSSLLAATIDGGWPKPIVLRGDPTEEVVDMVKQWPNLTPSTAAQYVKDHKAKGANYIKLMQENCCALALPTNSVPVATLELQTAVATAAHVNGLPCVGHALSADTTETILNSGADGLTHTFIDRPPPRDIIELYKKTGAFVIPTFTILMSLTEELQDWRNRFAELAFKEGIVDEFTRQNMKEYLGFKDASAKLDYAFQTIIQLRANGIDVLAGSDAAAGLKGTGIGPSLWMELELMVERCGFTVMEALHSATALPAKRLGFDDRGEVTVGRRADLVLVKGDVTERLQNLWEGVGIVEVWKQGLRADRKIGV